MNPAVASHGGVVSLVGIDDSKAVISFGGGCQGCGMAAATLRQGVETSLRAQIPEIRNIFDSTNHDAGENPYFPS